MQVHHLYINSNSMKKGTVKFYNSKSKFGFIRDIETRLEYYTHEKHLVDVITNGDIVEFEVSYAKRGPVAVEVRLTSKNP